MNVQSWLRSRRAANRYVRALLLLLQRVEAENGFSVDCVYVRTYHNTLSDWITREDQIKVKEEMKSKGWKRLELQDNWEELLRQAVHPTLRIPGEQGDWATLAQQLAKTAEPPRAFPGSTRPLALKGTLHQARLGSLLLSFEEGWRRGGGFPSSLEEASWVVGVLSNDPQGKEIAQFEKLLKSARPDARILVDHPREISKASRDRLRALTHQWGEAQVATYISSKLGSFFARKRQLWLFRGSAEEKSELETWRVNAVNECRLLPLKSFENPGSCLSPPDFIFTREPNLVTTGDRWLPTPVGHVVDKRSNQKYLVHSVKGVACSPRLLGEKLRVPGGTLLEDGSGAVRPLLPEEVWEMQGGKPEDWMEACPKKRDHMMASAVREVGWQAALSVMQILATPLQERAGVLDPEELQAHQQLEVWLQAWGRNPRAPSQELFLSSWKERTPGIAPTHEEEKAGGSSKRSKPSERTEAERLIQPVSKGATKAPNGHLFQNSLARLDQTATEAVLAKLADSTRKVYASGWKQWALYNAGSQNPLFLDGEERSARIEDEQRLVRFVVFLHQVMGRSVGGIKQRLSAIRYAHVAAGFPDPLVGRPRLWAAVAGLQRWEGAPKRKLPVTPSMLKWLVQHLKTGGFSIIDQAVIKGALLTGWFFMLRASELLPATDGSDPLKRAIRPADVVFYFQGKPTIGVKADEVVVQVRSSKTDQYGRGQARSHHRSGGDLCPVEALATLQVLQPHRWRNPGAEEPLFRYENGTGLDREGITHFIRIAALAAGFPGELAGSHSLRKGGATAFFASTGDLERLKRYGGWSSDAVHAYLYEDHTAQKGISTGMLHSQLITLPSQKDPQSRNHPSVVPTNEPVEEASKVDSGQGHETLGACEFHNDKHARSSRSKSLFSRERAWSWAPDRRVSFSFKAGSMEAANEAEDVRYGRHANAPDRAGAATLFVQENPNLDLYAFLGVEPGAPPSSVLKAYRKRARESHPDRFRSAGMAVYQQKEAEFKRLNAAREILLDPLMATQYYHFWCNQTAARGIAHRPTAAPTGVYVQQAQQAEMAAAQPQTPPKTSPSASSGSGAGVPRKPPPPGSPRTGAPPSVPKRKPPPPFPPSMPSAPSSPPTKPSARPPKMPPTRHRESQPYVGASQVEDLRVPAQAPKMLSSSADAQSSSHSEAPSDWPNTDHQPAWGEPWEEDNRRQHSDEESFVWVEVEEDSPNDYVRDFDEGSWSEPDWEDEAELETSSSIPNKTTRFDQAAMGALLRFVNFRKRSTRLSLAEGAPPTTQLPETIRETCIGQRQVSMEIHPNFAVPRPPPPKSLPTTGNSLGRTPISALKPPPPCLPKPKSSGAPPASMHTSYFNESEVDWDGTDEEGGDDRTEEEKKDDEVLLQETQNNVEAFLNAPPEQRKQLRSAAWKRCCEKLQSLRVDLDTKPVPQTHPGKFEQDLAEGFSYKEARLMQKGRERAARHQRSLATMEGVTFEDFPKSWSNQAPARVLRPGFLEEKDRERKWKKSRWDDSSWASSSRWQGWSDWRSQDWNQGWQEQSRQDQVAEDDEDWGWWKSNGR